LAEPLKNMYNQAFFDDMVAAFTQIQPSFNRGAFFERIFDAAWDARPLKERTHHVAAVLRAVLPGEYGAAVDILKQAAPLLQRYSYQLMFFPDFVEMYGLDNWDISIPALAFFTQYISAEFAVRPFIAQDTARMMRQMLDWAGDDNHHVRRLASEGCRPRLPWATALPDFKRDPAPILPILERLKNDPSEYVRRSVSNNLNDIAKDHPDVVLKVLRRWSTDATPETDWIIRRALRTLVKDGHSEALGLLGFNGAAVAVKELTLSADAIQLGETLTFAFEIESQADAPQDLMIDYVVYFMKANGSLAPKVFKLTQRQIQPRETLRIQKKHAFVPISTRVYYPGEHGLALKINGTEFERQVFHISIET
jgi:3-methyladenine DNA glycosylase AlkC